MTRHAASSPQPPDLPPDLARGELTALAHDASYANVELADVELASQHANGVTVDTTRLVNVEFSDSQLNDLRLVDSTLSGCNLANTQAQRATAARVSVETSRLTGIHLPEAVLRDVSIRDCRVDLASFGFSRLTRVTFEDCMLAQTDFLDAQLDSVRFHRCNLRRADFRGARMQRCEFRRSNLTGLQGIENLRGAAMEWPDIVEMAGAWATALGIDVLGAE
jgi:uncharacterized protein YjbI with pentapeptide repeats